MQTSQKKLTQADQFAQELKKISPDVTENDRKAFMARFGLGSTLISNYLNGRVANADTAAKMLVFFKSKIAKRNKLISKE